MISAVAPAIRDEFGLTYAQVGLPPMAALAFAAIGYASSGFLIRRIGTRRTLILSVVCMLIGAFGTANSTELAGLVEFQALAGLSEGIFYVDTLVLLTDAFEPATIGRAFGALEGAINVGILVSLTVGTAITTAFGWRAAYYSLTLVAGGTLILVIAMSSEARKRYQKKALGAILRDRFLAPLFIPIAILFLCFWSFWAFVPTYLTNVLHIPLTLSGLVGSASFSLAIVAALLGGLLADRVGPKKASVSLAMIYALSLVFFAETSSLIVALPLLLIITFAQAYLIPAVLAFIPKRFPEVELGRAYGIIIAVAYAAGSVGPVIVGQVADHFGFVTAFLVLAALVVLAGLILFSKL